MPRYICILSPAAPDTPALSDEVLAAHGAYLQGRHADGILIAAGPLDNPTAGLVMFDAADRDEADRIAEADPAVEQGGQVAHVPEWTVAIGGSRLRRPTGRS